MWRHLSAKNIRVGSSNGFAAPAENFVKIG